MKNELKDNGFTLIELLLVITILGILAAIAIPKLFPQSEKARVAEAVGILSAIRQGEEAYYLAHGNYIAANTSSDPQWDPLGMVNPNLNSRYFDYLVLNIPNDQTFKAYAFRTKNISTSDPIFNSGIQLDNTGKWCGNHPSVPANPDGSTCPIS